MLSYEPFVVGSIFIVPSFITKQLIFSIRPSSLFMNKQYVWEELNTAFIHVFYYNKCIFSELIFQYHKPTRIPIWISLHLLSKYLPTLEILEIMFRPNAFFCWRGLICNYRTGSSIMMYFITLSFVIRPGCRN